MRKARIGYLWETPLKAGERHIRRQVLGSRRFDPVVLTGKRLAPGSFPAPARRLIERRWALIKAWRKYLLGADRCVYNQVPETLRFLVDELRLELIHVFFGNKAVRYLPALEPLDLPISVSFHGRDVAECSQEPDLVPNLSRMFARVDCVMSRSVHMAERLVSLGCPETKLWINRAGVPLDEFEYHERSRRPEDPVRFIQVCRLIGKKGLDDTLEAFARVRAELPDARLSIVGTGELHDRLVAEIARRGLADAVAMTGFLEPDELRRLLDRADVFLHPSVTTSFGDQEGIPNSLLEAMATGLPPIATRHAGIPEAVVDGERGWLVEERSPGQLAERMLWCARNPAECRAAGERARRFIEQEHALDDRMRRLDEKYAQLIESRPRADARIRPEPVRSAR